MNKLQKIKVKIMILIEWSSKYASLILLTLYQPISWTREEQFFPMFEDYLVFPMNNVMKSPITSVS